MRNFKHIARTHEQHLSQPMATEINHAKSKLPFDHSIYPRREVVGYLTSKENEKIIDFTGTVFHLDGSITIKMKNKSTGKEYYGEAKPMPPIVGFVSI